MFIFLLHRPPPLVLPPRSPSVREPRIQTRLARHRVSGLAQPNPPGLPEGGCESTVFLFEINLTAEDAYRARMGGPPLRVRVGVPENREIPGWRPWGREIEL